MAPQLRLRTSRVKPESYDDAAEAAEDYAPTVNPSDNASSLPLRLSPPAYTIDLSLPPAERYVRLAIEYRQSLDNIRELFDDVLDDYAHGPVRLLPKWLLHWVARNLLKRVHSAEQTEELRGISMAINVPMYLLVAYNTFLDLLMGCTSGGARAQTPDSKESRMLHFRTLDWDMPELRNLVVQLDFVEKPGGEVIATSITYVGFVGVLTGVQKGLSVSLNFRPYHNNDHSLWANVRFRAHQVAVLLGRKPSVASLLRDFILPRTKTEENSLGNRGAAPKIESKTVYGQQDICTAFPRIPSTAAYLTFCNGDQAFVLEKDLTTATIKRSSSFIATTNHDASYDTEEDDQHAGAAHVSHAKSHSVGMQDIINESITRKACLVQKWSAWSGAQRLTNKENMGKAHNESSSKMGQGVPLEELKFWMLEHPVSNEATHFVCIMDPVVGVFRWARRFEHGEIH